MGIGIYLRVVTFSQKYVQLASPTDVCIYNDAIKFHRIGFCQLINAELKIFTSSLTKSLTVVSLGNLVDTHKLKHKTLHVLNVYYLKWLAKLVKVIPSKNLPLCSMQQAIKCKLKLTQTINNNYFSH